MWSLVQRSIKFQCWCILNPLLYKTMIQQLWKFIVFFPLRCISLLLRFWSVWHVVRQYQWTAKKISVHQQGHVMNVILNFSTCVECFIGQKMTDWIITNLQFAIMEFAIAFCLLWWFRFDLWVIGQVSCISTVLVWYQY